MKTKKWTHCTLLALSVIFNIFIEQKVILPPNLSEYFYIIQYLLLQLGVWMPLLMGAAGLLIGLSKQELMISAATQALIATLIILTKPQTEIDLHIFTSILLPLLLLFTTVTIVFLPFTSPKNK